MKQFIVISLLALVLPITCLAGEFKEPLTLTFYKDNKGDNDWADATKYDDPSKIDRGTSSHTDDKRYLGHLKFSDTEGPLGVFFWKTGDKGISTCQVKVDADPGVDELIYHLDTKSFEYADGKKPVLSAVHVRCDDFHDDWVMFGSNGNPVSMFDSVELGATDFEQPVGIQFQTSDRTITDYKWTDTTVRQPSDEEEAREEKARQDLVNFDENPDAYAGWTSAPPKLVGMFWYFRYRPDSRDFKWKLHDGDKEKLCHVSVNYDPHLSTVVVALDGDGAKIEDSTPGGGETKAVDVYCEDVKE